MRDRGFRGHSYSPSQAAFTTLHENCKDIFNSNMHTKRPLYFRPDWYVVTSIARIFIAKNTRVVCGGRDKTDFITPEELHPRLEDFFFSKNESWIFFGGGFGRCSALLCKLRDGSMDGVFSFLCSLFFLRFGQSVLHWLTWKYVTAVRSRCVSSIYDIYIV